MFSPSLGWQAHMEVTPCLIALRSQTTLLVSGGCKSYPWCAGLEALPCKMQLCRPRPQPDSLPRHHQALPQEIGDSQGDSATQKTPSEHPCDPFGLPMRISWAHSSPGPWRCPRAEQGLQKAEGSAWHGEKGTDMDRQCL